MFDLESLKNFDWRSLQKFTSPKAADDLNHFLEALPQNTSQVMLAVAGVVWAVAGVSGLYTTVQLGKITEMRAQLEEAQSVKPMVPRIEDLPVRRDDVEKFVDSSKGVYGNLTIKAAGSAVEILASSTSAFPQFREAISHVQNGGSGWRVNVENLCVGRECPRNELSATLRINKVSVSNPG